MNLRLAVLAMAHATLLAPACAADKVVGIKTEAILFYRPLLSLEREPTAVNLAEQPLSNARPTTSLNRAEGRSNAGVATVTPSPSRGSMVAAWDTALLVLASLAALGFVAHRRLVR